MEQSRHIITLIIALVLCSGCEKRLYNMLDDYMKESDKDTVDMTDIITEEWDTLYIFPPGSDLRPQYQNNQDIARRIVFVKDGHAVYVENEVAVEVAYKVIFDTEEHFFTPQTALFDAKRIDSENSGIIFWLTPIKRE